MQPFQPSIPQPGNPLRQTGSSQTPSEHWHLRAPDGSVFGPMPTNEVQLLVAQSAVSEDSQICRSSDGTWVPLARYFPGRPTETLRQHIPPQPPKVVQKSKQWENKSDEGHKEATGEQASPVQIAIGIVALAAILAAMILNWRSLMEFPFILRIPLLNVPLVLGGWIIRSTYSLLKRHQGGPK